MMMNMEKSVQKSTNKKMILTRYKYIMIALMLANLFISPIFAASTSMNVSISGTALGNEVCSVMDSIAGPSAYSIFVVVISLIPLVIGIYGSYNRHIKSSVDENEKGIDTPLIKTLYPIFAGLILTVIVLVIGFGIGAAILNCSNAVITPI